MNYLVRVGGELYLPVSECSAGAAHYESVEILSPTIDVKPGKPAFPYLKRLIQNWRFPDDPDSGGERVNLLHQGDGEPLVRLADISNARYFDFFVEPQDKYFDRIGMERRFQYRRKVILTDKRRLRKLETIEELFGPAHVLELTHVGSPGAELYTYIDDYGVVHDWFERENAKRKAELKKELSEYLRNAEHVLDYTLAARVLLAVASSEEPLYDEDIIDAVREDGYDCKCYFLDHDGEEDVRDVTGRLVQAGFLEEEEGAYLIAADYRKHEYRIR